MNIQVTPEAFFDSLALGHKLSNYLDGFKLEEIHLFSYFSSIIYLYAGHPIGTWPHKYIVSKGYPFSDSIDEAIKRHIQNSLFEQKGEFFIITGRGSDEYNTFKGLSSFQKRDDILDAVCTTSILIPYSEAIRALINEPEIKKVEKLDNSSWLESSNIYPKFEEISKAVGVHTTELIIPAMTWVNFLIEKQKA
jgi:hypothetical protein